MDQGASYGIYGTFVGLPVFVAISMCDDELCDGWMDGWERVSGEGCRGRER